MVNHPGNQYANEKLATLREERLTREANRRGRLAMKPAGLPTQNETPGAVRRRLRFAAAKHS